MPYYVVVVNEGEPAELSDYETEEQLISSLKSLSATPSEGKRQVFIFSGTRWQITGGTYPYLQGPTIADELTKPIPLFDLPDPEPPDPDGYTGHLTKEDEKELELDMGYQQATEQTKKSKPTVVSNTAADSDTPWGDDASG